MKKIVFIVFAMNIFLRAQDRGHLEYQDGKSIFFYPRVDKFELLVEVSVGRSDENKYSYQYSLKNLAGSEQSISDFIVYKLAPISKICAPPHWIFLSDSESPELVWGDKESANRIKPGEQLSGFQVISSGLPSIHRYFSRANVELLMLDFEPDSTVGDSLFGYGKQGRTIVPKTPPDPFNARDFADSLISFIGQAQSLGWIPDQTAAQKYLDVYRQVKSQLQGPEVQVQKSSLRNILLEVQSDSGTVLTSEAYALIRYNTEYLLGQLPEPPNPHLIVKLTDSRGELIRGGSLQYYEGEWKAAGDRGDGTFEVATELPSVKLRMTYEHGVQEKSNVPAQSHTAVFRTIRAGVRLAGSSDSPMDTGRVQYYAGGWRDFGATLGGSTEKELLPANYKFRMTYAHGSNEKYQDIGADSVVVFRTVPATVELRNSAGNPTGSGEVKYYSGGWWDLGVTSGGAAVMELLPANYKFRMTYAKGSSEKYQDIGSNPVVTFQTVPARVELRNSAGVLMDQGDVKYYSGGWWDLGATSGGAAVMELLPANYKFRMTYAHGSNEKYQDIGSNPVVTFQAVPARVELRNSEGSLMDQGEVKYYSGGWWDLGTTSGGVAGMELLPANYKFRMTYARGSNEMYQDIGIEPLVRFGTVTALVRVMNQQGNPLSGAEVWYYSGGWYPLGSTGANGSVSMELLPLNYKFRARFGSIQSEKYQDVSVNPAVDFGLAVPGG